ncbi:MAG TPA: M14 family zinc carboxypeptidase [Candidatus Sumerlaeota bacterium]|nr:M14 family zinc carboxypeptidase [Candidatus Sumerlaeota bacterium]HOR29452.1 M14 family zinc carboxypeptidase [Candidatus Sumerlaeota bacterium]
MTARRTRFAAGALLFVCLALMARAQQVTTITAAGLGYPVPAPVESLTPVDGFRSLASLRARYAALALEHDFITPQQVGQSRNGRPIDAYLFATADEADVEGRPKPAAMLNGTIHAREWASPEVVAAVAEWLAGEQATDPVARYLIENTTTLILPVGNPDGFQVTQTYPDQTFDGGTTGASGSDGRMRRKNLRDADEMLTTAADRFNGVDLNRNHPVGWSSASPLSAGYGGPSPGSEAETAAFAAAAGLLAPGRLRFYVDIHSYSQLYYVIHDSHPRRNALCDRAHGLMTAATLATSGRNYINPQSVNVDAPGEAIGATDEYMGKTYRCMSYTLELRPTGGSNGFILPAAQIAETRREILAALRAGLYFASGPAALIAVEVWPIEEPAAAPLFRELRRYDPESNRREIEQTWTGPIEPGARWRMVLRFNKPLRERRDDAARLLPGADGAAAPELALPGLAGAQFGAPEWLFTVGDGPDHALRYGGDSVALELDLANLAADVEGRFTMSVQCVDLAGQALDADPRTPVDWSENGWVGYEDDAGLPGIEGGADQLTRLPIGQSETGVGRSELYR